MLFLKEDEFNLTFEKKVIKAEEYSHYLLGQQIIENAQKKAEKIISDAKVAYENEKKLGHEEGVEIGKQKMMDHMMEYVSKTVEGYESFEEKVLQIIMQALVQILGKIDDKELIMGVVKQVVATVRTQKEIILKIAPSQRDYVQSQIDSVLKLYPSISFIDVIADPRLKEGDCIAETDVGVVDGRLEMQLESIRKSFNKKIK